MNVIRLSFPDSGRSGLPSQNWIAGSELAQMPGDLDFSTDVFRGRDLRAVVRMRMRVRVAGPVCLGHRAIWESGHEQRDDLDDNQAFACARSCGEGEDLRVCRLAELGPSWPAARLVCWK